MKFVNNRYCFIFYSLIWGKKDDPDDVFASLKNFQTVFLLTLNTSTAYFLRNHYHNNRSFH